MHFKQYQKVSPTYYDDIMMINYTSLNPFSKQSYRKDNKIFYIAKKNHIVLIFAISDIGMTLLIPLVFNGKSKNLNIEGSNVSGH